MTHVHVVSVRLECFLIIELKISLELCKGFFVYLFGTSDLCIQQDIDTDKVCLQNCFDKWCCSRKDFQHTCSCERKREIKKNFHAKYDTTWPKQRTM